MSVVPTIAFEYRASRALLAATIVVGLLALVAVPLSGSPHWLRAILYIAGGAVTGVALARSWRPRVGSVAWRPDGSVELRLNDTPMGGQPDVRASIRHARVMGPLIVLTLAWCGGLANLWLLPDNLDADTRRRLRIRLRTEAGGFGSVNADSG